VHATGIRVQLQQQLQLVRVVDGGKLKVLLIVFTFIIIIILFAQ